MTTPQHPYRERPPAPRTPWRLSRRYGYLAAAMVALVCWVIFRKRVDPAWQRVDVRNRSVRSIAVAPDGRIFVAAERNDAGHLMFSTDHGATFHDSPLVTGPAWRVTWLPRLGQVCLGGRRGLYCGDGEAMAHVLVRGDIYFAIETHDGALAGGYPSTYVGDRWLHDFTVAEDVSYASDDAVLVGDLVFRGGDHLYMSEDGGRHMIRRADFDFGPRVLGANGRRVYAAGGTFGGSFARSDDGGEHWRHMPFTGSQPEAMWVHPRNADVVIVGTHGDVRRGDALLSTDGGATWRELGCPGAEVHGVAVDDRYIYCGATAMAGEKGLWRRPIEGLIPPL
jgi:hypothetical protein